MCGPVQSELGVDAAGRPDQRLALTLYVAPNIQIRSVGRSGNIGIDNLIGK